MAQEYRSLIARHTSAAVLLILIGASAGAQTRIEAPSNKYTPAQDVELGRRAASQVERQLPILSDRAVSSYVTSVGRRLVAAAREINAFALPGGPIYLNRGMIEAVDSEAEMAGVIAHELSHVALRHGTAQASRATKYEIGALGGAILGALIGGRVGTIVSEGTRFGHGTAFLRFGREFERQADTLGAQVMARAG